MPTTLPDAPVQRYDAYTPTDYRIWRLLSQRQREGLRNVACAEYLHCLKELYPIMSPDHPPRFTDLNRALTDAHGWSIEVVKGFLPVDEFFALLANRRFCSSTWLRSEKQLDYLEEPDMFHDIFGHIPLYLNKEYADFAQKLGALGVKHAGNEERITQLQRPLLVYHRVWGDAARRSGESLRCRHLLEPPRKPSTSTLITRVVIKEFNLDEVMQQDFVIDKVQMLYFAIDDFASLFAAVDELESRWN